MAVNISAFISGSGRKANAYDISPSQNECLLIFFLSRKKNALASNYSGRDEGVAYLK